MKNRIAVFVLGAAAIAATALAQTSPLPLPSQVEKELAARAANVTEVTLGKNMLDFAAKFMNNKKGDEAAARQLIQGLDGIYVREYEFDKTGEYSMDEIEKLRQSFETPEWSPVVHERERKSGESTDVLIKQVNGETRGMFVLSAEPKELTIVLILGPIRMDQLGMLKGLGGLGSVVGPTGPLSGVQHGPRGNGDGKSKDKDRTTDKKGGNQ